MALSLPVALLQNRLRDSLFESRMMAGRYEQLAPTKYKTTNWSTYNDALKRRGSLELWFDPEMVWVLPPGGKRGRQQQFSDAAIQACLTLKVLFGMPLRQTTGFVQSLLRLFGLEWAVPDYSMLCRPLPGRRLRSNLPRGASRP